MRRLTIFLTAVLLAGCSSGPTGPQLVEETDASPIYTASWTNVWKFCDNGRLVYLADGRFQSVPVAMTVIEDAKECRHVR